MLDIIYIDILKLYAPVATHGQLPSTYQSFGAPSIYISYFLKKAQPNAEGVVIINSLYQYVDQEEIIGYGQNIITFMQASQVVTSPLNYCHN